MASIGSSEVNGVNSRQALKFTDCLMSFNNSSGKDILQRSAGSRPRNMAVFGIRFNLACNEIFLLVICGAKGDTKILHKADMLNFIIKKVVEPCRSFKFAGTA